MGFAVNEGACTPHLCEQRFLWYIPGILTIRKFYNFAEWFDLVSGATRFRPGTSGCPWVQHGR